MSTKMRGREMPHLIVLVQLKQKVCNVSRSPTATATGPQLHEIWAQFRSYSDYILLHSAFFNIQFLFSANNQQNRMFYSIKLLINTVVYIWNTTWQSQILDTFFEVPFEQSVVSDVLWFRIKTKVQNIVTYFFLPVPI